MEFLYARSEPLVGGALLTFLLAASELGFRLGRRRKKDLGEALRQQVGNIQTAGRRGGERAKPGAPRICRERVGAALGDPQGGMSR